VQKYKIFGSNRNIYINFSVQTEGFKKIQFLLLKILLRKQLFPPFSLAFQVFVPPGYDGLVPFKMFALGISNKKSLPLYQLNILVMPTVLRTGGFRYFFYVNDHSPMHIHVEKGKGTAKFKHEQVETIILTAL